MIIGAAAIAAGALSCAPSITQCDPALELSNPPLPEFIVVEYVPQFRPDAPASVQSTPQYEAVLPNVKSVALRVNDGCLEPTITTPTDAPAAPGVGLKLVCERWEHAIERALVDANLRVFSWRVVLEVEREKHLPTHEAARELGADVVFVLNHLDAYDTRRFGPSREGLRFFYADEQGRTFGRRILSDATVTGLGQFLDSVVGERVDAEAGLDVTALLPATGETIWSFRKAENAPLGRARGLRFLFGRYPDEPWRPIEPALRKGRNWPLAGSFEIQGERRGSRANDAEVRDVLLRAGAEELVEAFEGKP